MRDLIVKITKAHIRDGVRGSECNCPIGLALQDALLTSEVSVTADRILVNNISFEVDKRDLRFMERFDSGERVRPYSFSITRPNRR